MAEQLKVYEVNVIWRFESTDDVVAACTEQIRLAPGSMNMRILGHLPAGVNHRCLGFYTRQLTWVPADGTPDPGVATR